MTRIEYLWPFLEPNAISSSGGSSRSNRNNKSFVDFYLLLLLVVFKSMRYETEANRANPGPDNSGIHAFQGNRKREQREKHFYGSLFSALFREIYFRGRFFLLSLPFSVLLPLFASFLFIIWP